MADTTPELGEIVIYRSRDGADMPGLITGIANPETGDVHLELFSPPHVRKDILDPSWGAARWDGQGEPGSGTWRPRGS